MFAQTMFANQSNESPTGAQPNTVQQQRQEEQLAADELLPYAKIGKGLLAGANMREKQDLFELLKFHSVEKFSPQGQGMPSLLVPMTGSMIALPQQVTSRVRDNDIQYSFCGLLPEIKRAWASVDTSLFLWRYDRPNDVALEFEPSMQAVSAVGIVKPRVGVFADTTSYILVVCCVNEISLQGMKFNAGSSSDELDGLEIEALPDYTVSSDGIPMSRVVGSSNGRIFAGGSDGQLYEIIYKSNDNWIRSRCFKIWHTRNLLGSLIPQVWKSPSSILQIVVDSERQLLYTLSQNNQVQVFYLGNKGDSFHNVAQVTDFVAAGSNAMYGTDLFRNIDKKTFKIVGLYVIPTSESSKIHMMAITNSGVRVYFTTIRIRNLSSLSTDQKPETLQAVCALPELQQATQSNMLAQLYQTATSQQSYVKCGQYSDVGLLLVSGCTGNNLESSEVMVIARSYKLPRNAIGGLSFNQGLTEVAQQLDQGIPGECQYLAGEASNVLYESEMHCNMKDELYTQIFSSAPKTILMTGGGVVSFQRRRPIEILMAIFQERSQQKITQFFEIYGRDEAAAMCYHIACSDPRQISNHVLEGVRQALSSAQLVGYPSFGLTQGSRLIGTNLGGSSSVGGPSTIHSTIEFSAAHNGLILYVARLTNWASQKKAVELSSQEEGGLFQCGFTAEQLQWLERRLRVLSNFLSQYCGKAEQRLRQSKPLGLQGRGEGGGMDVAYRERQRVNQDAHFHEEDNIRSILAFVQRAAEALALLQILSNHHIGRLLASLDKKVQEQIQDMTFGQLVAGDDDEQVSKFLVLALLSEHLTSTGTLHEDLAERLQRSCPSYFNNQDKIYYQGVSYLQKAEQSNDYRSRQEAVNQGVDLMLQVPLAIDLESTVFQLQTLRNYDGIIRICQAAANANDPYNQAFSGGADGDIARQKRNSCYIHIIGVLRNTLFPEQNYQVWRSEEEREQARKSMLRGIQNSDDKLLQFAIYAAMIEDQLQNELLESGFPYIEEFFMDQSGLRYVTSDALLQNLSQQQIDLVRWLAKFYTRNHRFRESCAVYSKLAEMETSSGGRDVLQQRLDDLQDASLQAKSAGESVLDKQIQDRYSEIQIQLDIYLEVEQSRTLGIDEMNRHLQELSSKLIPLNDLFNDYAQPFQIWSACLKIIHQCGYQDPQRVRHLWDVYLQKTYNDYEGQGLNVQLRECCLNVGTLGSQFYPDKNSFPVEHVALRLELIGMGLWPRRVQQYEEPDEQVVVEQLRNALQANDDAVLGVYDGLLFGQDQEDALLRQHPGLRERMIQSLGYHCKRMADVLVSEIPSTPSFRLAGSVWQKSRKAEGLVGTCRDKYAPEARRLGLDAAEDSFGYVVEVLQHILN